MILRKYCRVLKIFLQHCTIVRVHKKNERECLEYLHSLNIPKLSEAERNSCEGLFTKKECWEVLSTMENGKKLWKRWTY